MKHEEQIFLMAHQIKFHTTHPPTKVIISIIPRYEYCIQIIQTIVYSTSKHLSHDFSNIQLNLYYH